MVTQAEGERLAVLETQMQTVQEDVAEIKIDVKTIVRGQVDALVALTATQAADMSRKRSRADIGIWVRMVLPLAVAIGAVVMSVLNFVIK